MKYKIREVLRKKLSEELVIDIEEIPNDYALIAAGIDSINVVLLIISLEEEFGIEFPEEVINGESFSTINEIEKTINRFI
ncbi:phosphopantetheine-binding protein [Listeria booriae]|uniref:phosphopantetheine-binding protein n=1 Tax=Listeria booriae TaxID=1552123 RepID=UPI001623B762|nr:phosphopantetheine-binding protein [Listeria booriae]MBC1512034.1 acyl carrier protein [Listeria booriae]MBC6150854.1 acyl carrier protein [Listeria booriae]MBC6305080.1 acyl carrier protein [Listeria booriae]